MSGLDDILRGLVAEFNGDLVVPTAATEVCEKYAAEVDAWLADRRVSIVTQHLGHLVRVDRATATRRAPERGFASSLAAGEIPPAGRALDEFTATQWAHLWLTAEQQGIGAARSQGYGRYEVIEWERAS